MSNLKIGPVDITSGTASFSAGGLTVGYNQLRVNADGTVTTLSSFFPPTGGCTITKGTTGDGTTMISVTGDVGKDKGIALYSGSSARWSTTSNSSPETGSNAGSNYIVSRYSDAGVYIDSPVEINRANGVATFVNGVKVPTRSAGDNTEYAASTSFVLNAINTLGSGVTSFNTRTGSITLTNGDVLSAVGNIVNTFNGRSGKVTLSSSDVTTALGYIPTNASSFGLRVKTLDSSGNPGADYGNITNPVLVFQANSYNVTSLAGVTGSNIHIAAPPEPYIPPPNNSGFCVHPLSAIMTITGVKFAQDVRPGDQILSSNGQFTNVISTWLSTLGDRKWLQVNGETVLTPDHPIKLADGKWGIFDRDFYFSTYPDKEYVCKTQTGMRKVSNSFVTSDNSVVLEEGSMLSDGKVIDSLELFEGTTNYPVIHFVTEADAFVSDGILVSSMGSCI